MATFSSWWNSYRKNPTPKKISWVCGNETILVDEVVDTLTKEIDSDAVNTTHLDASLVSHRDIWNSLRQLPFGTKGNRLTVVREAQSLLDSPQFIQYVKDRGSYPKNYVIFISNEPGLRKVEGGKEMVEPLDFLKTRGSVIECRPFTQSSAKYAVAWVMAKGEIKATTAEHLLNRATGDLRLVRDTLRKLSLFSGEISLKLVNDMFEARPADDFLSAIFALDRKTALKALEEVPPSRYKQVLGLLDARLDLAGKIHDMQIEYKTPGEIARASGSMAFLVPEVLPVAKHYDKKRRLRIRQYLAMVDGYSEFGALPDGTMESMIAIW